DDTVGRVKAYEAIVKGENIAEPSIPESFKVLLKEMQSLALDVNVVSEEGQRAEMRDEDDDLLRAAEELGIDLSGVRATDGGADGGGAWAISTPPPPSPISGSAGACRAGSATCSTWRPRSSRRSSTSPRRSSPGSTTRRARRTWTSSATTSTGSSTPTRPRRR